jgi:gas vesicle protein
VLEYPEAGAMMVGVAMLAFVAGYLVGSVVLALTALALAPASLLRRLFRTASR